uniref:Uncharacterized protein n=1 Tax=Leersia perrieri TaxID=77586 RepID=A0A0D9V5H2_9ORYZ
MHPSGDGGIHPSRMRLGGGAAAAEGMHLGSHGDNKMHPGGGSGTEGMYPGDSDGNGTGGMHPNRDDGDSRMRPGGDTGRTEA